MRPSSAPKHPPRTARHASCRTSDSLKMNLRLSRLSLQGTTATTSQRRSTVLVSRSSSRTWTWCAHMTPSLRASRSGSTSSVIWLSRNSKGCRVSKRFRTLDLMPVNSYMKTRKKRTNPQCRRIASIIARLTAWNARTRLMKLNKNQSTVEVFKNTLHLSIGGKREL